MHEVFRDLGLDWCNLRYYTRHVCRAILVAANAKTKQKGTKGFLKSSQLVWFLVIVLVWFCCFRLFFACVSSISFFIYSGKNAALVYALCSLHAGTEAHGGGGERSQGEGRDLQPLRLLGEDVRAYDVLLQRGAVQREENRSRAVLLPRVGIEPVALVFREWPVLVD